MNDSHMNNLDALYDMAKQRHAEAIKNAAEQQMARKSRSQERSRTELTERPSGLIETVLLVVGRWGRQAAEPLSR